MRVISGFIFNDYCQQCQKVTEHRIGLNDSIIGACVGCNANRSLTALKQVFYSKVDLWITRFKVSNLDNVVAGKLLDTIHESKN